MMCRLNLTAGIFIGAVWANVSWGRYWGWDPKEVWALITMLIYSLGIHQGSLKWFRNPKNFHIFCILAFLSVLITYFGVNFLLGGLHSYAWFLMQFCRLNQFLTDIYTISWLEYLRNAPYGYVNENVPYQLIIWYGTKILPIFCNLVANCRK